MPVDFREKLADPGEPMTLFEMVPPAGGKAGALEAALAEASKVAAQVDAINLPEIHDEARTQPRTVKYVERIEPRTLGARIRQNLRTEVVVNRCVVYDSDPIPWFESTVSGLGLRHVVVVGGESSRKSYPGPGVIDAARRLTSAGIDVTLGGIAIPSRVREADRIRRKAEAGLSFFTTQVLFDANDIVWLIQRLNGLDARIFLSFAPVSHPRDLEFLRWLGVDIPADLDRFLLQGGEAGPAAEVASGCFERSLDLCRRILMDVFDNLPPDPPAIGLNIEHINKRNFAPALQMLDRLRELYAHRISARSSIA